MKYQADIIIDCYLGHSLIVKSRKFRTLFWATRWAKLSALLVDWFYPTHPGNGIRWGIRRIQ